MIPSKLVWLGLVVLLVGCPPVNQTDPKPSPTVTPRPTALPFPVRDVEIAVTDSRMRPLIGAKVSVSGSVFPERTTVADAQGFARFPGLRLDTPYVIRVEAAGYLSTQRRVNLSTLSTSFRGDLLLAMPLQREMARLTGRIVVAGQPLSQAVVSDGSQSVLTEADGTFALSYVRSGEVRLQVARQGYKPWERPVTITAGTQALGDLSLTVAARPLRSQLDILTRPLGMAQPTGLTGFESALQQAGHSLNRSASLPASPTDTDILWILSPSQPLSEEQRNRLTAFVAEGGKLVVTLEWAGFGGFSVQAARELLKPFGLEPGEDTLREESGQLSVLTLQPHFLTEGVKELSLYQSASIEATSEGSILARSSENSFRIASSGAFGVLATSLYGAGKVVVVGDTSLWLDSDSANQGRANLAMVDNRKLLERILAW